MNRTSSLSLVAAALAVMAASSAPAVAEDDSGTSFNDDLVRASLIERGYDVSALAQEFNKIRATVTRPDGSSDFVYFDINSLQPLDGDRGDRTRVLSDLDVGGEPAAPSLRSLTWVDPDDL